jgi:hypothetical protein
MRHDEIHRPHRIPKQGKNPYNPKMPRRFARRRGCVSHGPKKHQAAWKPRLNPWPLSRLAYPAPSEESGHELPDEG